MKPDENKVKATIHMEPPQNKGKVRSLIGMIIFLNRYTPSVYSLLKLPGSLIKKDIHLSWTENHDKNLSHLLKIKNWTNNNFSYIYTNLYIFAKNVYLFNKLFNLNFTVDFYCI